MNLRTVSYNIRNGHDVQHDMSLLAADLLAVQADIVGLQEVDVGTARVGGRDTLAELAKAAGFAHYRFCRAIDFAGGEYGTAILSRYPILSFEITPLPTPVGVEGRSVGHACLDVDGTQVDFFNTHLSCESDALRALQLTKLKKLTAKYRTWILTGDFNTARLALFDCLGATDMANPNRYATFPESGEGIDNILCSTPWCITDTGTLQNRHSDHLLLWAELHDQR